MATEMAIVTFFTTHGALRAEKLVTEAGIPAKLVPTPRRFSADCTVALSFPASWVEQVQAILDDQGVPLAGVHRLDPEN